MVNQATPNLAGAKFLIEIDSSDEVPQA